MTSLPLYRRSRKDRPEARLQRAVVEHLRLTALDGVIWFSVPNEGRRSAVLGSELKRMGMKPGVADLCIIIEGRAHFLELKSADGKASPEQRAFRHECEAAGIPYRMAFGIDEALGALRSWRALPDARRAA